MTRRGHQKAFRGIEALEQRAMLTTLLVDNSDLAACSVDGDDLYCEIQDAVDAAEEGDEIQVATGAYRPVVVAKDNLAIHAKPGEHPVIDGDLNDGAENNIELNASGVIIQGLTIQNASGNESGNAILVSGDNNRLLDNTVTNNYRGIHLVASNDNVIAHNVVEHCGSLAVLLESSNGNVVKDNTASFNHFIAYRLIDSDNNVLRGNSASHTTGLRAPFGVVQGSDNNLLVNNVASHNSRTGFGVFNSDSNTLRNNKSEYNLGGFGINGADDNILTNNTATGNTRGGFSVGSSDDRTSSGNMFIRNTAVGNQNGFSLGGESYDNRFIGNTSDGNVAIGFELQFADDNVLMKNIATGNGSHGFWINRQSAGNTLRRNLAADNGGDGFRLESIVFGSDSWSVSNTLLQGNVSRNNAGDGFHLMGTSGNTLRRNEAEGNMGDGFAVETVGNQYVTLFSDTNLFAGNDARNNDAYGFWVDQIMDNAFERNDCEGNGLGGSNLPGICD